MGIRRKRRDTENFTSFGPCHLTSIDWNNSYHRTSVTASLVKGVYMLEVDRQKKRVGTESLAKPWWDFFRFILLETLIDEMDSSIYGAVFEYELYNFYQNTPPDLKAPPRYVIAFRGTNLALKTMKCDLKLDLRCFFNNLHDGARFVHAIKAIKSMVDKHREQAILLTGHSLGAGLALLAGKTMIKYGFFLETHIFNPPISSIPLEHLLRSKKLGGVFRLAENVITATLGMVLNDHLQDQEDDPKAASWIPHLYVNPKDIICSEYTGYFQHKILMSKIGASKIESISARNSLRSRLVKKRGRSPPSDLSTEPLHHLPSADMTLNLNKPTGFMGAHGLHQWWEQDSNWESHCIRPHILGINC